MKKKDFLDISTKQQIETKNNIKTKLKMLEIPIKEWYQKQYSTDKLAEMINSQITFSDVYSALFITPKDIYDVLGVSDSLVRERIFKKLSELLKVPYKNIYNAWLAY